MGMAAMQMKQHAAKNDIWAKVQLGMYSGVLGKVNQLLAGNAIKDEVWRKK